MPIMLTIKSIIPIIAGIILERHRIAFEEKNKSKKAKLYKEMFEK